MASSIWTGHFVYDYMSVPIALSRAAHRKRLQFHFVYAAFEQAKAVAAAAGAQAKLRQFAGQRAPIPAPASIPDEVRRVQQRYLRQESDTLLTRDELYRAYTVGPDKFVTFTSAEVSGLNAPKCRILNVLRFVPLNKVGFTSLDVAYNVSPGDDGEKGYSLLHYGLATTGCAALGDLVLRGREYRVVVVPDICGLVLFTLYFPHEVRPQYQPRIDGIAKKHLKCIQDLIRSDLGPLGDDGFKDHYEERAWNMVLERWQQQYPWEPDDAAPRPAEVVEITEALYRSLASRKPVKSERSGPSGAKGKRHKN
jgi:DNA end-binding protein Ku